MKTYVITLSKTFPKGHFNEAKPTLFKERLLLGFGCPQCDTEQDLGGNNVSKCNSCMYAALHPKLHTIRGNYSLWEKRFKEIDKGNACLSIREWSGKPYRSEQVEIVRLTNNNGIGLQRLDMRDFPLQIAIDDVHHKGKELLDSIANNDGLSRYDWQNWFGNISVAQPLAIIHFTKFRY